MPPASVRSDTVVLNSAQTESLFLNHSPVPPERQRRIGHPDETHFHITAFTRFFNVPVNPTELIVRALPQYLARRPLNRSAHVASTEVFEVAAQGTLERLGSMYTTLSANKQPATTTHLPRETLRLALDDTPRTVFIHLGVNMSSSIFNLEWQARNEATFSCPDEQGWRPIRCPIDSDLADISATRYTSLDLPAILHRLKHEHHCAVNMSKDAGRFVCNWTYYNSLKLAEQHGAHALFVHVPPATIIPIERQVAFVATLLDCISLSSC